MPKNNYKKIVKLFIITIGLFFYGHFVSAEALNLPKDSEGWTIFTPSDDSRIMYVSATGNDSTGTVYDDDDAVLGGNPFNPTGPINSFATYAAAYSNTRQGYPDWVLFKRGDTFVQAIGSQVRSGRSVTEPFVVGAYGSTDLSPLLKVGAVAGITIQPGSGVSYTHRYVGIQGIRIYAHTRNPADPDFSSYTGERGLQIYGRYISNILIEGCSFEYTTNNTIQGEADYDRPADIDIRRNKFLNSFSTTAHSQGLGGFYTNNVLIEENIFDHNGWLIQSLGAGSKADGQAVIHNHSTYFTSDSNWTFRNNVSLRPSSIHNKLSGDGLGPGGGRVPVDTVTIDNNLYIDGEVGLDFAGNAAELMPYTAEGLTYTDNVLYKIGLSNPTDRNVSWGLSLAGVGGDGANIYNNIILNNNLPDFWLRGIMFDYTCDAVNIHDNIVYGAPSGGQLIMPYDISVAGVEFTDNYFRNYGGANGDFFYSIVPFSGYAFSGNTYYDPSSLGNFYVNNSNMSTASWAASYEPTATFTERAFTDDTRTVETYMASIGKTATLDEFIALSRAQDRYDWDIQLTADAVNSYIRTGFGMGADIISPAAPHGLSVL